MNKKFKQITREQNSQIVADAAGLPSVRQPHQGWIKTLRSALAMSGAALSKRLSGHRSTASYLERSEQDGSVTLKKMQQVADAMGCRFVYGIVPPNGKSIDDLINERASLLAERIVEQGSVQMMLEDQQLSPKLKKTEVQRLKSELLAKIPREFWDD